MYRTFTPMVLPKIYLYINLENPFPDSSNREASNGNLKYEVIFFQSKENKIESTFKLIIIKILLEKEKNKD